MRKGSGITSSEKKARQDRTTMTRKAASTKDQIHLITFKGVAYTTVPLVRIELSLGPQLGNAFLVLLELGLELRYHVRGDGLLHSGFYLN